jgi:transcriptional regulator with XRE-family HTH domain
MGLMNSLILAADDLATEKQTVYDPPMEVIINAGRIKERRDELGLSQEEAARRAGFNSKSHWSNVELGYRKKVSVSTLYKIALALSLRMDDLVQVSESAAKASKSRPRKKGAQK